MINIESLTEDNEDTAISPKMDLFKRNLKNGESLRYSRNYQGLKKGKESQTIQLIPNAPNNIIRATVYWDPKKQDLVYLEYKPLKH